MQTHLPTQATTSTAPSSQGYAKALSETIKRLVAIFGQDITYARLSHIPEIKFSKDRTTIQINGQPEHITHNLQTLFSSLSQDIVDTLILPSLQATHHSSVTPAEMIHLS